MTPELALINCRECIYGFNSSDFAFDILEDIINYDTDQSIITHQLEDVIERLDGIILSIENTHRTIIQKIKTEKLVENNLFNESKLLCKTKKSKKSKKSNDSDSESESDSDDC
jgi:hypothetical protein